MECGRVDCLNYSINLSHLSDPLKSTHPSPYFNLPSFSSIYLLKSSIVHTRIPHFLPNSKQSSLLIILPPFNSGTPSTPSPSVTSSQIKAAGSFPANLHISTAASV